MDNRWWKMPAEMVRSGTEMYSQESLKQERRNVSYGITGYKHEYFAGSVLAVGGYQIEGKI